MRSVGHITHRVFLGIIGGITGVVDIAAAASISASARLVHNTASLVATTTPLSSDAKALMRASTLFSTHRARSPRTAMGTGAMATSKSKWGSLPYR